MIHEADPQSQSCFLTCRPSVRPQIVKQKQVRQCSLLTRLWVWPSGSFMANMSCFFYILNNGRKAVAIGEWSKNLVAILKCNFDPLGRTTVTASSDHYFQTCLYFLHSQLFWIILPYKKNYVENNVRYWLDCGAGRMDHWWSCLVFSAAPKFMPLFFRCHFPSSKSHFKTLSLEKKALKNSFLFHEKIIYCFQKRGRKIHRHFLRNANYEPSLTKYLLIHIIYYMIFKSRKHF